MLINDTLVNIKNITTASKSVHNKVNPTTNRTTMELDYLINVSFISGQNQCFRFDTEKERDSTFDSMYEKL